MQLLEMQNVVAATLVFSGLLGFLSSVLVVLFLNSLNDRRLSGLEMLPLYFVFLFMWLCGALITFIVCVLFLTLVDSIGVWTGLGLAAIFLGLPALVLVLFNSMKK